MPVLYKDEDFLLYTDDEAPETSSGLRLFLPGTGDCLLGNQYTADVNEIVSSRESGRLKDRGFLVLPVYMNPAFLSKGDDAPDLHLDFRRGGGSLPAGVIYLDPTLVTNANPETVLREEAEALFRYINAQYKSPDITATLETNDGQTFSVTLDREIPVDRVFLEAVVKEKEAVDREDITEGMSM